MPVSLPQLPPASPGGPSDAGDALGGVAARAIATSLYIHVPFCSHKCHYCDFYSIVDTRGRQEAFTDRLVDELRALAPWAARPLRTVFVGGGTPSMLEPRLWERVLGALHTHYDLGAGRGLATCGDLAAGGGAPCEFTVECNPETVTPDLLRVLVAGGVNRLSMGAQSFHAAHLVTLERRHDPASVPRAIALARDAGVERLSVDLIYAVPGQTRDEWRHDLDAALALGTEHLSCYALTYEPNTAMTARLKRGEFARADEDLEADLFEDTVGVLRAHGLDRYEVSNFARPGAECRHNLAYWRDDQWLAAGPSASAHVAGRRWKNTPRLDDYLDRSRGGFSPIVDFEGPDARRALAERLMTGLRLREGLDASEMLARAGALDAAAPARLEALARKLAGEGLLSSGARWAPTDSGFLVADRLAVDFLCALDPR